MPRQKVTRGDGRLEGFLAQKRAQIADRLIPDRARKGRVCDIGCGHYPYFLTNTEFACKFGVEQERRVEIPGIEIAAVNLGATPRLPFDNDYFDAITMLAVLEHFDKKQLASILREIYRVLKAGGTFIITTPTLYAAPVLDLMVLLKLVSVEEINEHKDVYTFSKTLRMLLQAGFQRDRVKHGYFEFFMNMWVAVTK